MTRIASFMSLHRKLSAGLIAAAALVALGALVPLPYSVTTSWRAQLTASPAVHLDANQYVGVLKSLGITTASVNVQSSPTATLVNIGGLATENEARKAGAVFAPLTGVKPTITLEPVKTRISGTLLAQTIQKVFRVEVETAGLSDSEIEAEVAAQVRAQGGEVKSVDVQHSPDGQTTITIESQGK